MSTPTHYLNTPRAILFQLTAVISSATGGVSSAALKTYTSRKSLAASYGATLNNAPISAAGGLTISAGALAGSLCGALFIVIMVRPGHPESRKSILIKEVLAGIFSILFLIAALVSTIITAQQSAKLEFNGISAQQQAAVTAALGSLAYKSSAITIAYVVLDWICFALITSSLFLISKAGRHVLANGPAVGVPKGIQERYAEPYVNKMFGASKSEAAISHNQGMAEVSNSP